MRPVSRALAATSVGALGLALLSPTAASAATAAKPYDFNGDGYRDVVAGSPLGTVGKVKAAGFVTVAYGDSHGVNGAKHQVLSQNTANVPGTAEAADHFGYAVASADFDKDGYADLVVSAPDEDAGSWTNSGSLTIFWGTRSGLSTYASAISSGPGWGSGTRAGLSLAAGDFNRGGYADFSYSGVAKYGWGWFGFEPSAAAASRTGRVATGHRGARPAWKGAARAAETYPTLKVASGYVDSKTYPSAIVTADDPTPGQSGVWVLGPKDGDPDTLTASSSVLGQAGPVAAGDFDGDGYGDVAVGNYGDSGHLGGQVVVYKGSADGLTGARTVINADTAGVPGGRATGDLFGASLSAGDVNGDGKADLAIGAPGVKVGTAAAAGGAYLLLGSPSGLTGAGSQWVSQATEGVPGGAEAGDHFGWSVALGDLTKDGKADLVVGVRNENGSEGTLTTFIGRSTGIRPVVSVAYIPNAFGVKGKAAYLGYVLGNTY
ncbi:FG-GAP and VCBS repeat-containing protein [Actinomadura parmotrematis]|uniref:FG-GAP-like repeat-containing protein n=1 Tax=Actinomadura parmotrematis TaxID=2864039 RepID=A0ABS7FN12_9ACTN|nr:FG-GAP and VCBS repeat-containing protein [Actinomadura parmotrematis]MBW8481760.1 FG-GAP-like repeat-containing protein [Actinomadura parmotrematis]